MLLAWQGVYLGLMVGQGKKVGSWHKPANKYAERSTLWAGHGHGLQYNALTYNTFTMFTLSYVAQLEAPPDWVYELERKTLRKAAPGPGNWATAEDLWHLKDAYGLPRSFKCLRWLAQAAQLRVHRLDPAMKNKSQIQHRAAHLRSLLAFPFWLSRLGVRF